MSQSPLSELADSVILVLTRLSESRYGILGIFRGLASIVGPIIGGLIWSTIGPVYVFVFIIIIQILRLIVLGFEIPETLKIRHPSH